MKLLDKRTLATALCLLTIGGIALLGPAKGWAQGSVPGRSQGWWGSAKWFDWSDYRASVAAGVFLVKLDSGHIAIDGASRELNVKTDLGMDDDPEPFRDLVVAVYLDRMGVRYHAHAEQRFVGNVPDEDRMARIRLSTGRVGLDLDLIRYPFLTLGVNMDYHDEPIDIFAIYDGTTYAFDGGNPITCGIHAHAIPFRLRDVPFTIRARARLPFEPLLDKTTAKITTWEVGAGLRPPIWELSDFGHSTFSVAVEAGFRFTQMELLALNRASEFDSRWQGAYFRLGFRF